MDIEKICAEPNEEDLREALKEMQGSVNVNESDLRKIYAIALRLARARLDAVVLVREVMTKKTVAVRPETPVDDAARLLSEQRISGMPVVDGKDRVLGVLSEKDLFAATGATAGSVMSTPPITALADDDVRRVAAVLDERRIKRLPVVDQDGVLLGIISRADIVRVMGKKM